MHYLDSGNFSNTKILKPGETVEALTPKAARQLLEDNGVEFSEKSFVCLGFNPDIVKLFLQAEINPNVVVELGYAGTGYGVGDTNDYAATQRNAGSATALIIAAGGGRVDGSEEALRIILEHGADPNIKTYWPSLGDNDRIKKRTALAEAINSGNRTISELLIGAGAKIEQSAVNEQLLVIAGSGDPDKVKFLLERFHPDPDSFTKGDTPLIRAADDYYVNQGCEPKIEEILKLLLAWGADVNRKNSEGQTALMAATAAGAPPAILLVLLTAGAEPRAKDKKGRTALMLAKHPYYCDPLRAALEGKLDSYAADYTADRERSEKSDRTVGYVVTTLFVVFIALIVGAVIIAILEWVGVPIPSGLMYWINWFLDSFEDS